MVCCSRLPNMGSTSRVFQMTLYLSNFVFNHFWEGNCLNLFVYCCCFRLFPFLLFLLFVLSLGCIASFLNRFIFPPLQLYQCSLCDVSQCMVGCLFLIKCCRGCCCFHYIIIATCISFMLVEVMTKLI